MICYVLVNGDLHPTSHMQHLLQTCPPDLVVVADGGIRHLRTLGIQPDVWLGDFDSTPQEFLELYPGLQRIPYPTDKNLLDSEIAVEYALEQGATTLILWGALGGRSDHSLAVVLLSTRYPGIQVILHSGTESVHPLHPVHPLVLPTEPGQTLSILALLSLEKLNIRGVQWELHDAHVQRGSGWTMSNVALQQEVRVWCASGLGVVVVQHP